jgi:hypothetical protein
MNTNKGNTEADGPTPEESRVLGYDAVSLDEQLLTFLKAS